VTPPVIAQPPPVEPPQQPYDPAQPYDYGYRPPDDDWGRRPSGMSPLAIGGFVLLGSSGDRGWRVHVRHLLRRRCARIAVRHATGIEGPQPGSESGTDRGAIVPPDHAETL